MKEKEFEKAEHVVLTSHKTQIYNNSIPINWGVKDPLIRGPIIATTSCENKRNAIGTHSGSYTVYRALSIANKTYPKSHVPDLKNTHATTEIGPFNSWFTPEKIVSIDPWGAQVQRVFKDHIEDGYDIRPTIAVTQARLQIPELAQAISAGRLVPDGKVILENGDVNVTKVAFEPVWYLPGIAKRIGVEEGVLRKILFKETGGMFPELVTRPDLKVLLPPIGSSTAYIFGDVRDLANPDVELSCRVHDECNGSDVFGSDICTCRPYLTYGIEHAAKTAQKGGVGLVVYFRKEGRALGEVTKFLVYNARKRQKGGDSAANYFYRTECVAGVEDARFQELMPDILHYFGIQKIHKLHSMSNMKYDAIVSSGIEVVNRISIPDELIPEDALVEIEAKKAAGYFTQGEIKTKHALESVQGRELSEERQV
ncbi:MAG: GTP cyclohydrolase II [Bacteriovoracaceae bacterium]|nr:GTP cyclohydrolase II [Bacteriovoracaceae bacterium]